MMFNIAILASGGGSNAGSICRYYQNHKSIKVALIISNKETAGVLDIAKDFGVPSVILKKSEFNHCSTIFEVLRIHNIDYIILAGFLLLLPECLIQSFPNKILNIHPSLLPKYGGQGMYGSRVHRAVKENKDIISGLTIHLVNEKYDEGKILFQASCAINAEMNEEEIAKEVLKLEHLHYSPTIENYIFAQELRVKTN